MERKSEEVMDFETGPGNRLEEHNQTRNNLHLDTQNQNCNLKLHLMTNHKNESIRLG